MLWHKTGLGSSIADILRHSAPEHAIPREEIQLFFLEGLRRRSSLLSLASYTYVSPLYASYLAFPYKRPLIESYMWPIERQTVPFPIWPWVTPNHPKPIGKFWGRFFCICNDYREQSSPQPSLQRRGRVRCKRDYKMYNVMQTKGHRRCGLSAANRVLGLHSAVEVWYLRLSCFLSCVMERKKL